MQTFIRGLYENFENIFRLCRIHDSLDGVCFHTRAWCSRKPTIERAFIRGSFEKRDFMSGWIGVDLDGTLAHYEGWQGPFHIGEPVLAMKMRVLSWLHQGIEVRIVTARASQPESVKVIEDWLIKHLGVKLTITDRKDFGMLELWDDRAIRVEANTGKICCHVAAESGKFKGV